MLGAGETQVFASVLHGPKDARGCPRRLGSSISLRGKNPTPSVEHIGRNNMSTESCRAEQEKKNTPKDYIKKTYEPCSPPMIGRYIYVTCTQKTQTPNLIHTYIIALSI